MNPEEEKQEATPVPPKKTSLLKRVMLWLFLIFVAIQFLQPGKNNQSMDMRNDISQVVTVPDTIQSILKNSCYDCHSNFTNYPWYSNIQPLGWWLKRHIDDGKSELNFQEFALIKPRAKSRYKTATELQIHKLEEISDSQADESMPLESYTFIHRESRLSASQRKMIVNWVDSAIAQLR